MTAVPIDHAHRREPAHRRTMNKVLRFSRRALQEMARKISDRERNVRLIALKLYRRTTRKAGQRWGAAGTICARAIELFELLLNLERKSGIVTPSAEWLAHQLQTSRKMIHAWKEQLRRHGFLSWDRRCIETGRDGVRGPQVHQTSNRYYTHLPEKARRMVEDLRARSGQDPNTHRVTDADRARMEPAARAREERKLKRDTTARRALADALRALGEASGHAPSSGVNANPLTGPYPDDSD